MRLRERGVGFQRRRTVAAIVGAVLALGSLPAGADNSVVAQDPPGPVCPPGLFAKKGASSANCSSTATTSDVERASAPIRIGRIHRFQRANEPDQHRVRGGRARFRRREERRHQGLRQPQRHDANRLRRPSAERPQLLGPGLLGLALDPSLTNPALPSGLDLRAVHV